MKCLSVVFYICCANQHLYNLMYICNNIFIRGINYKSWSVQFHVLVIVLIIW